MAVTIFRTLLLLICISPIYKTKLADEGFISNLSSSITKFQTKQNKILAEVVFDSGNSVVISEITPNLGPQTGGTSVAIRGENFPANPQVLIDGVVCQVSSSNNLLIECVTGSQDHFVEPSIQILSESHNLLVKETETIFYYYQRWSDKATWEDDLPKTDEDVVIAKDQVVLVDIPELMIGVLKIQGVLIFEDLVNMKFNVEGVILDGGKIIIGSENAPHVNDLEVILRGDEREGNELLKDSVMCIDCEMQIHGKNREGSQLTQNAFPGDTSVEVENSRDFQTNSEIQIFGNSKKVSEKVFIYKISEKKLFFKQPLQNKYLVENKLSSEPARAEFLTENIKFVKSGDLNEEKKPMIITKERNHSAKLNFSNFDIETLSHDSEDFLSPISTRKIVKTALRLRPRILANAASTGNWSSTSVWNTSTVPTGGDVTINAGQTITLDQDTAVLDTLTISGTLTFSPTVANLTLQAKVIVINDGGELNIGSASTPFPESAKIVLHGASGDTATTVATGIDPVKNAIINKGTFKIYGDKTRFVSSKLVEDADPASNTLKLDNSVHGWKTGDKLVIPSSFTEAPFVELGTIQNVVGDTITLDSNLSFKHKAYMDYSVTSRTIGVGTVVVNLTKNIVIESNDPSFGFVFVNAGSSVGTTFKGHFIMEDVQFKNSGQTGDDNYALKIQGNGSATDNEMSIMKRCSFHSVLGQAIGISFTNNVKIQETIIYEFQKIGIVIIGATDIDIDGNHIIKSNLIISPAEGVALNFNFGVVYADEENSLDATEVFIRNNRVSSLTGVGVGFMVPGTPCTNKSTDANSYHFQGNLVHSSDVGLVNVRNFPKTAPWDCQKFSHFKAFKILKLGIGYFGDSPQTEFDEMVISDSQYAMMNVIEPLDGNTTERRVTVRNSGFIGRTFLTDASLYANVNNCETNGITTPLFSAQKFATNPLWTGVDLTTYFETNLLGRQVLENVTFKNFNPDTGCTRGADTLESNGIRINPDYQNSPIALYLTNVGFENVNNDNRLSFPAQSASSNTDSYCKDNTCDGVNNSAIFDTDGSFSGDGVPKNYYGGGQSLTGNTDCIEDTATNTYSCSANYGQIFVQGSTQNDGELFPLTITSNESLTGGTASPFSNTIRAGVSGGGQIKLKEVNTFAFQTSLTKNVTLIMTAANVQDWSIIKIDAGAQRTLDVYKAGTKIDRYTSQTIDVKSLMLFAGDCGKNIFERSSNTLYLMMNGTANCSVELRPVSGLASSLKLDVSNTEFFNGDGVKKVKDYLVTASGLSATPDRINVGMVRPGSTIVEFEIKESGTATTADGNVTQLDTVYCTINTYMASNGTINSWNIVDGLGMATVLVPTATKDFYIPSCNTNPHDKIACTKWSDDTNECETCGRGFTKNGSTCVPSDCATPNATTGQCTTCNTNFYLDSSFYNTCVAVTTITDCDTYQPAADLCATCTSGHYLEGNQCKDFTTSITDCVEYATATTCKQCIDTKGTSGAGASCIDGTVTQCKTYTTSSSCTACNTGHYLASSSSCPAYTSDLNCKTFNTTMDQCTECNTGFRLVTSKFCEADSSCSGFSSNNLDCSVCASGYYLDPTHTVCRARTLTNCQSYVPNADQCATCPTLHWLDTTDGNKCKAITTVPNCFEYETNSNACKTCEAGRELVNNDCPYKIVVIDFCSTYQTFGICSVCESGRYLYQNGCEPLSAGCSAQTSPTVCTACDSSNFLNGDSCSVYSTDLNCKTFKDDADECVDCNDYYYHDPSTKKCVQITSCETFDVNKVDCTVCKAGNVLNTNTKQCDARQAANCKTVLPNIDQCDQCNEDSYKDAGDGNKCKKTTTVDFCQVYQTTSDACKSCIAGYYLDTTCKEVTASIDQCKFYSDVTTCTTCNDGYYLSNNKCPKGEMVGCLVYSGQNTCTSCETGFFLVNGSCGRYSPDLNCETFNASADSCVDCPDYYKLDGNNKCQEVLNCKTFAENKEDCTECQDDYYLPVSKVCTKRAAENCTTTFSDRDQCSACAINYWLDSTDNNLCKSITPVQYCNTYKTNANECAVCVSEKYLATPNSCSSVINEIAKCNFYEGNGQCKTCEDGYFLNNSSCTLGTITGCKVYESQTQCSQCSANYYLTSTKQCSGYSSDLNCLTFNPTKDECTDCEPYHTLDSSNKCKAIQGCEEWATGLKTCSKCEDTYYLDQFTMLCVLRTRSHCATTQPDKDECATCNTNYYMDTNDDNICKAVSPVSLCGTYSSNSNTCEICNSGHYLNQNSCTAVTSIIARCKIYQSATVCQTCEDGNLLTNGACNAGNVNQCKTYVTADQCYECMAGSYITNTFQCTTYTADLNCKSFDPRADRCIDCPTDYNLTQNTSCKRLSGCSELESNNTECKTCKPEFLLNSTTKECVPRTASNCETYHETEDKCSTCASGFYFDSDTSECKNRLVYKSCQGFEETEDKCTVCTSGFYLINGSCKSLNNPIAKCAEYSADGICQTCENSFNLKSGNTECVQKLENCKTTNDNDECTQCNTGYYLKDPKQCVIYSFHPNCTNLDPAADKCLECTDFHKLDDSNVCVELSRCQEFDSDNKTCVTCKLAYALNKTTKECESQRPERCHIWDPSQGVCEECHSPYKLEDNECVEDNMTVGMILLIFFLVLFIILCIILLILLCLRCCMKKDEPVAYGKGDNASIDTFQSPNIEYKEPTQQSSEMTPTPAPVIPLDEKPAPLTSEIKKKQFSYNPRVFDEESGGFRSNEYGTTQSREFGTDDRFKMLSTQGDSKRGGFETGRTDDITKSNNIMKSDVASRDNNTWRIPEEDEKNGGNNPRF